MGNLFTVPHILILLLIILLLFGRGKISDFMGDFAKGIKSFKNGLKDDEVEAEDDGTIIEGEKAAPAAKPKVITARKTVAARKSTVAPKTTTGAKASRSAKKK